MSYVLAARIAVTKCRFLDAIAALNKIEDVHRYDYSDGWPELSAG
ncbi:hypothetical protein Lepto7375DRAFT_7785 [Leptolyngbya sp. PCC 7375]|nr:hypothetical protein Lepto7375DRAFT_7785 [Leptolyngbya sp. PCC 7375]